MPYVLGIIGLLMLGYAVGLFVLVRRGRRIPQAGYLGLLVLNGVLIAALLAWAVSRR
ncbi:hypothetical protein [Plantactinospora sp. KBS50]|uniref:hypothetical protein n=1 Tax=Plantactinospora sp. KBS50 TaxID=2024580 RepID=UPI0018E062F4|nr:hypothetical protein [Plantactinospora sp. KBS50]